MQIHDSDVRVLLPKPVDAADPLLDPHWVPRHVVIHQRPAELKIQPLGSRIGAEKYICLAFAKAPLNLIAGGCPPCSVRAEYLASPAGEAHDFQIRSPAKLAAQEIHGVGELGEHH